MKKTEAISILATSVRPREAKDRARYDEAVRMAIEALKCSETPKSSEQNAETAQADHVADISKKAEGDCISRQEALKICRRYWHPTFDPIMEEIEKLPSVQPERVIIDDCLHHIYKNISVHTATGGVIAIRYYMEKLYEEIYGEGEKPWWMT